MFLHVSVILFTRGGLQRTPPGPGRHHPRRQGEPPLPGPGRPPRRENPPGSKENPPGTRQTPPGRENPPGTRQTPPREEDCRIRSMSGWYASYWNAFLFSNFFTYQDLLKFCPISEQERRRTVRINRVLWCQQSGTILFLKTT